jgi:hypothetical protein
MQNSPLFSESILQRSMTTCKNGNYHKFIYDPTEIIFQIKFLVTKKYTLFQ